MSTHDADSNQPAIGYSGSRDPTTLQFLKLFPLFDSSRATMVGKRINRPSLVDTGCTSIVGKTCIQSRMSNVSISSNSRCLAFPPWARGEVAAFLPLRFVQSAYAGLSGGQFLERSLGIIHTAISILKLDSKN